MESAEYIDLEVLEALGQVVRTSDPAREGEERDRWTIWERTGCRCICGSRMNGEGCGGGGGGESWPR